MLKRLSVAFQMLRCIRGSLVKAGLLFLGIVFYSTHGFTQNPQSTHSMPLSELVDLAEVTSWSDIPKATELTDLAIKRLKKEPDDTLLARILNIRSYQKALGADYSGALEDALTSRPLAIKNNNLEEQAVSYRMEGLIQSLTGDYAGAIDKLSKAIQLHQEIQSPTLIYAILYSAIAYEKIDNNIKALEYARWMLTLSDSFENKTPKGSAFFTIGRVYTKLKEFQLARDALIKSKDILTPISPSLLADVQFALAFNEYQAGNMELAQSILNESKENFEAIGAGISYNQRHILAAKIHLQNGELADSIAALQYIISNPDRIEKPARRDAYEQLSIVYEAMGDFENAMQAERSYKELNEDIFSEQSAIQLALAQTRSETAQKERQIAHLESENQLNELRALKAEEGQTLRGYLILLVVLILLGAIYVIRRNSEVNTKLSNNAHKLQAAYEEAEAANRSKSDFLARMSHEIRTPMNAIIGLGHLFHKTRLDHQQKDYLTKIQLSSEALLGIINDILDFSKIEAGKMDIEHIPFSIEQVFKSLSSIVSIKAQKKGLELVFDIQKSVPPIVIGDPTRVNQILINLVNNAIKFTQEGEIVISVCAAKKKKKLELTFKVSDTGIGMTKEQQNSLFQPFAQADESITRKYGGTGLGLSICKQLTELMAGDIWVESQVGEGSSFTFTLIVEEGDTSLDAQNPIQRENLSFLIVDDNEAARRVLKNLVSNLGFEVETANNGKEAVNLISTVLANDTKHFDFILMDWEMPEMDGIEATKRIHELAKDMTPPSILMVTAHEKDSLKQEAEKVGIEGFLTKPVNASELFDSIVEAMSSTVHETVNGDLNNLQEAIDMAQLRGARVLLVEDNPMNERVASAFLKDVHLIVDHAENGKIAVEKASKNTYDLILMDVRMPVMDGFTATREIRKNPNLADLPIIAMTADAMSHSKTKSLNAGMNDYISKPFEPKLFYQKLQEWIPARKQPASQPKPVSEPSPQSETLFDDEENDFFDGTTTIDATDLDELDQLLEPDSHSSPTVLTAQEKEMMAKIKDFTYINGTLGVSQMSGKIDFYLSYLADYLTYYSTAGNDLEQYLKADDREQAALLAHSMKSIASSCGAPEYSKIAGQIEDYLRLNNIEAAKALLPDFQQAANKVLKDLQHL